MKEKIDLLNRTQFIQKILRLVKQLSDTKKGCCFSIEGSWGIGKSFLLEEMEESLENVNEQTNKYFVFHYNCWEYDYYEEPAIAIVSAMISSILKDKAAISVEFDNVVKAEYLFVGKKLEEIAGIYLENKIGVNLIEWAKQTNEISKEKKKATYEFDKLFNFSQAIENVRKNLKEIATKRTIVFVVDELDRCIPKYAIKVLERLHHIFYGLENVVVIMAIDRNQLEHSVEEMFGMGRDGKSIDVEKYLKKFIDFGVELDNGIINESFEKKYNYYFNKFDNSNEMDMNFEKKILPVLFEGIDIRRTEKIVEKANLVHSVVSSGKVDISVLYFELLYEVLRECEITEMESVVKINSHDKGDFEGKLGKEKFKFLKEMEQRGCSEEFVQNKKGIHLNLCGRIFWYFGNIFNDEYYFISEEDSILNNGSNLEIAKKYVEFGEIIK